MAGSRGWFDDFAERSSRIVSRAPYFAFCVLLVIIWAPSYFLLRNLDTWQLIINTATTIITFLMVALLENSTQRFEDATNAKLDTVLKLLAELQETSTQTALKAVGIEKEIGT
jgi:low affinity Fe/Cu permease